MGYTNDCVRHIKNGKVQYLEYKIFDKYSDKLKCITTLKHGGVSSGEFESLNFRSVGSDSTKNVEENLNIICKSIGIHTNNVFKAKQEHTDNILLINSKNKDKYLFSKYNNEKIDGYITNEKNIATLVTTADCNPIIIYDPANNVVANVHSGWKGTVKRIYLRAIDEMIEKYNSNISDLIFCLGPSICKCCFTSKEEEFKNIFLSTFDYSEKEYISYDNDGTFHIDLHYVIYNDLLKKGLKKENISFSNICTRCNYEDFYSYRYARQNEYNDYATMATIVSLI